MVNRQVNRRDKGGKGSFDYRPSDPKKLRERAERSGGQFDSYIKPGVDTFKPKVGENALRILPPTWKDHDHFGLEVWIHGYVGTDRSSYLCPKKMLGKKCPICDAAKAAIDAGEKDEGDDIKAKQRVLYWVIDRDGETSDPLVWSVSWTMDKDISGRCEKRSGKILELDNPWKGHDVTFRRTGQGLKTRYPNLDVDSDPTPLADREKEVNRLLEFVQENPLPSILKYYDYEYLAGVLDGTTKEKDEDLDDDDEDDGKKKKKGRGRDRDEDEDEDDDKPSKSKAKKRGRDDDDDDDEDEDEKPKSKKRGRDADDDDEDEDDKPSKSKTRGRAHDDDDDDDDDEDEKPSKSKKGRARDDDEDDDDEDEKPKSKKKRGRDEDEDDPADDDDDDDDDEPKSKKKKRPSRDDDEDEDDEIPSSRRAKRKRD